MNKDNSSIRNMLTDDERFIGKSENELVLLKRFVNQRSNFLRKHALLSSAEVFQKMRSRWSNSNPTLNIRTGLQKNQLIAFKYKSRYMTPSFQFDANGQVLKALLSELPTINSRNIDHLDLCFWLTSERHVTLKSEKIGTSFQGLSYERSIDLACKTNKNATVFRGQPLHAATNNLQDIFSMLVDEWLNPDTYDIYRGKSV